MNGTASHQIRSNSENDLSNYINGIYSYGKDCGLGNEIRFTNLTSYIDWMDSVIYNTETPVEVASASKLANLNDYKGRIVFIDRDEDEDDSFNP